MKKLGRGVVIDVLRVQRFHEAKLVGNAADMRQKVADPCPALASLTKRTQRTDDRKRGLAVRHRRDPLGVAHRWRYLLTRHLDERRLVIERIDVRHRAEHVQTDYALRTRRHVTGAERSNVDVRIRGLSERVTGQ